MPAGRARGGNCRADRVVLVRRQPGPGLLHRPLDGAGVGVDDAGVVSVAHELAVELGPALGLDLTAQRAADVEIGARSQFLRDEIGFLQMSDVIEKTMAKATFISVPTYEDYVATDAEARKIAEQFFN